MPFHTRFNPAERLNKDKVYDRHDNVDRLSYMDNTKLIQRFIYEGQNLAMVRARALRSGMYTDSEAFSDNSDMPIIPVLQQDPAITQPIVEQARESLKSRVTDKHNEFSNDNASSDSDLPKRSPDSTVTEG